MSLRCTLGFHSWDFCTCHKCGKTRDEDHNWQGCKCPDCGKTRDLEHKWKGCKCSVCGKIREDGHDWYECKCRICGKENPLERLLALGTLPDPYISDWPELCQALYHPEHEHWLYKTREIRGYAYRQHNMPGLFEALYPLLQSHNNDLKFSAIVVLLDYDLDPNEALLPQTRRLVDLLVLALSSNKSDIRCNSARVLANMKDARAIKPLAELMRGDPDGRVREMALWSIKALGAEAQVVSHDAPAISLSDIQNMTDAERLNLLREIARSVSEVSPPGYLDTYEKRRATARHIGALLNAAGGFALMRKTLEVDLGWMPGCRTIEEYWDAIGEWHG